MATKAQLKQLRQYLTELRTWMRMDNWDIVVLKEVDRDPDALASVQVLRNHHTFQIRLGEDFWGQSPRILTNTLVHEFIHALHGDVSFLWEDWMEHSEHISKVSARDATTDFHIHMERFVSDIAKRLAPFAPQWPGAGVKESPSITFEDEHWVE